MSCLQQVPIASPCVGVCILAEDGLCEGCLRTGQEIGSWLAMTPEQRAHVIDVVLPARAAGDLG